MNLKNKILITFFLIFIFCIFLSFNKVDATFNFIYDNNCYVLDDVPFDTFNYCLLYNSVSNKLIAIEFKEGCNLGYSIQDNRYYMYDTASSTVSFNYSTCIVTDNSGDSWSPSVPCNSLGASKNYEYIAGKSFYPCYKNEFICTDLPAGISWDDDIIIGYCNNLPIIFYPTQAKNYVFSCMNNLNKNYFNYRPAYNSSTSVNYYCYNYNYDTNNWNYFGQYSSTNCYPKGTYLANSNYIYYSADLLDNENGSVLYSSVHDFFFKVPVLEITTPLLEGVEELPKAIITAMKILVPVGLIVLGIGLVIYLIRRVIYSHL